MQKSRSRKAEYANLVARRKRCRACKELTNPSRVERGCFDSDHIGPWSRWQGNLSAELMVVGQDWGDTRYFHRHEGLDEEHNPTNRNLVKLFKHIGITIGPAGTENSRGVTFFTNAVLCLKEGGLQGKVKREWFENCARFLREQVEIIKPLVVVTLGEQALRAVRDAFGLKRMGLKQAVADRKGEILTGNTRLMAVYHCGVRVINTHRPMVAQKRDWRRVERVLCAQRKNS